MYIAVNYSDPKWYLASCFSDSATAPSPQALIPTIPAVFLILNLKTHNPFPSGILIV